MLCFLNCPRRQLPLITIALFTMLNVACAGGDGTGGPDSEPSAEPAADPSADPSVEPSASPEGEPAAEPDAAPSAQPDAQPEVEPTCEAGELFGVCDGADAIEVCNDGAWGSYSCNSLCQQQGEAGGSCGPAGESDDCICDSAPVGPVHGSLCDSGDSSACGFPSSGLLCVVENQGDVQGTCRVVCNTFVECTDNDEAIDALDTECCDVLNGSRVCANDMVYPDACER